MSAATYVPAEVRALRNAGRTVSYVYQSGVLDDMFEVDRASVAVFFASVIGHALSQIRPNIIEALFPSSLRDDSKEVQSEYVTALRYSIPKAIPAIDDVVVPNLQFITSSVVPLSFFASNFFKMVESALETECDSYEAVEKQRRLLVVLVGEVRQKFERMLEAYDAERLHHEHLVFPNALQLLRLCHRTIASSARLYQIVYDQIGSSQLEETAPRQVSVSCDIPSVFGSNGLTVIEAVDMLFASLFMLRNVTAFSRCVHGLPNFEKPYDILLENISSKVPELKTSYFGAVWRSASPSASSSSSSSSESSA